MNSSAIGHFVTRTAQRMTNLLYKTVDGRVVAPAPPGLPAGAVYLPNEKVIFAATACRKGVFNEAMWAAATLTDADIVVAHQGRYPSPCILDDVSFSVLMHVAGVPFLFEDMILYWQPPLGYWLLPTTPGPSIVLDAAGLRIRPEPVMSSAERAEGLAAAAAKIIRATRLREAV